MIDSINFKYRISVETIHSTVERHRTLSLTEATTYFKLLFQEYIKSRLFEGKIELCERIGHNWLDLVVIEINQDEAEVTDFHESVMFTLSSEYDSFVNFIQKYKLKD